jgi:hypothetical protein
LLASAAFLVFLHPGRGGRRSLEGPQAKAAGNIFDGRTAGDERGKCLSFVGWVHSETVEVLREAGLDRGFSTIP